MQVFSWLSPILKSAKSIRAGFLKTSLNRFAQRRFARDQLNCCAAIALDVAQKIGPTRAAELIQASVRLRLVRSSCSRESALRTFADTLPKISVPGNPPHAFNGANPAAYGNRRWNSGAAKRKTPARKISARPKSAKKPSP